MTAILAIAALAISAAALDLPTKTLNGTKYYYYKVKKNETVYGVSKKLGLTREEIVAHNPAADDGIKKGMILYFPYDDYSPEQQQQLAIEVEPEEPEEEVLAPKQASIAVLLPFGLTNEEPSRSNRLALDFYKGFLMAADTLASRSGALTITAIDTDVPAAELETALVQAAVREAAVIVAPDNEAVYNRLAASARDNGNYVLNVFIVADSLYAVNPQVLQANIPQRDMYRLAVDAFEQDFDGYTPVILRNRSGRNEKEAFVNYLIGRCSQRGVTPVEISYDGNLVAADLDVLPADAGQKYVMVPSSGSLAEFHKFAYVVKAMRDRLAASAEGAAIEVFGYPDWTAFRGDNLDTLNKLEATVYSRFFDNFDSFDSKCLQGEFRRWYGSEIIESIPSQAVLGYDTGCFLIKNLRANDGAFNPLSPRTYNGMQSTFDFDKSDEGYFNSSLYIIKFNSNGTMISRVI